MLTSSRGCSSTTTTALLSEWREGPASTGKNKNKRFNPQIGREGRRPRSGMEPARGGAGVGEGRRGSRFLVSRGPGDGGREGRPLVGVKRFAERHTARSNCGGAVAGGSSREGSAVPSSVRRASACHPHKARNRQCARTRARADCGGARSLSCDAKGRGEQRGDDRSYGAESPSAAAAVASLASKARKVTGSPSSVAISRALAR